MQEVEDMGVDPILVEIVEVDALEALEVLGELQVLVTVL